MTLEKAKQALTQPSTQVSLQDLISKSIKEFKQALPTNMRPERLVRIALTCIRQNPDLASCNPPSFIGALLVSAQLGIEPIAGRAYILPFWNNGLKRRDAQFIMGYKGIAELFYRHEKAVQLNWGAVHKNDDFDFEYGTQSKLRHKPAITDRGEVIGYYVIAELHGGAKPFLFMSKADCMEHGKKHSKTYNQETNEFSRYSPWYTDPDSMCLKTVLIQLSKLLPLSIELQRAIQTDETSREYSKGINDALDIPPQDWQSKEEIEEKKSLPENKPEEKKEDDMIYLITDPQIQAIWKLAKIKFGDKWESKLLDIINKDFKQGGIKDLTQEEGANLIKVLNNGGKNA